MESGREVQPEERADAEGTHSPLLERVADFYHKSLLRGRRGLRCLERLGLEESHLIESFGIGHCDGRLLKVLPAADPRREELRRLGLAGEAGERMSERLLDHLVVPLRDEDDGLLALWGIHIRTGKETLVPANACPLWNLKAAKLYPEVLLCGRLLDGLSLAKAGFPNAMGLASARLTEKHVAQLKSAGARKVALLAEAEVIQRLRPRFSALALAAIALPRGETLNARLAKDGEAELVQFVETRLKSAPVEQPLAPDQAGQIAAVEDGLTVTFGNRTYVLRGIEKTARRLRATLRTEFRGKLHVDTLDFYNARCRKTLAQDLCRLFEESASLIETDIGRIVKACEDHRPSASPDGAVVPVAIPPEQRAEAEAFGKDPGLLERIAADYEACGLIGEKGNKLIGYLAAVSRKLDDPLSILILSSSGAGKSALQDATLAFCPPEDVVKLTSLTGKALFYKGRTSLQHKVLALEEGAGAREAAYAIRNLVSAKVLVIEAAVKDFATGRLTTMENRVEGPTSVFITTTDPDVDPETRSRFIVLTVDESREQTRAILEAQRRRQTLEAVTARESREGILRRHRNFQRLLAPLLVVNPYAGELDYGDDRLQSRRDHPKYLNLIRAVAFLRQMGRETKAAPGKDGASVRYIEATREDIEVAGRLMRDALGRNPDDLNGVSRALLAQIGRMADDRARRVSEESGRPAKPADIEFTRREIREYTGWSHARVQRYLGQLVDFEYIIALRGRNGCRFVYVLAKPAADQTGCEILSQAGAEGPQA